MVHDDKPVGLDGVEVEFDDERVVSDAGVMLVATRRDLQSGDSIGGAWVALAEVLPRRGPGRRPS